MSLNIKNERVHELAREAARRTGKSQTSVIEDALRKLLDDLDREATRDERWRRAEEVLADMQARIKAVGGLPMLPDDLYDPVTGLPA